MRRTILIFGCLSALIPAIFGCTSRYLTITEKIKLHDEQIKQSNMKGCVPGCILFEGDSNMELIDFQDYFSEPCCNYSKRGSTTEYLIRRMKQINKEKPDIIVMLVGGNDLLKNTPLEVIDKNYSAVLSYYKTITKKIYCISSLPVHPNFYLKNPDLINLNRNLERICARDGAVYVNAYPHFLQKGALNQTYARDMVHLNKAGQDLLVAVLKKYMKK